MPDLVDVYRRVLSDDGFGGVETDSLALTYEDVPTRITQGQVIETPGLSRDLEKEVWTLRFAHDADIQDGDILHWVSADFVFEATDRKDHSWQTALSVRGERVKDLRLGVA